MNLDDRLRDAFDSAAPRAVDARTARAGLAPRMRRARRLRRVRVAAVSAGVAVSSITGTAFAIDQLRGPDQVDIGPVDQLPAPSDDPVPAPEPTRPGEPAEPSATVPHAPNVGEPTTAAPEPTTTAPVNTEPTTTAPVADPTTTLPSTPAVSGPHETACGTLTLTIEGHTLTVASFTAVDHRFTTEGDGTDQLHAKWDEGPGEECQLEAHFEGDELRIEID